MPIFGLTRDPWKSGSFLPDKNFTNH